ncbi:glycoside hydrolase family 99-like domain-containing protein [Nocardioides sp.]|uniref:glycoside hydrolase family 99-like domain-containing protein n=1 Tax=Nocardioides sp. TaxID=35761 RepID=UPI0025E2F63E|nr:glycoside hydrolase family 99-like domain-containing protein [Nocardioides sp.]
MRQSPAAWEPPITPEELAEVAASGAIDEEWYRARYVDVADAGVPPLIHYLTQGWVEGRDPGPGFSTQYYLDANPDVAESGMNPLVHYTLYGWREGRAPRDSFVSRPPAGLEDFSPLTIELAGAAASAGPSESESRPVPASDPRPALPTLAERSGSPAGSPPGATALRTVAFYLPQFHPIPENDEWWGEGFTEWTNVVRGTPSFGGHQQPNVPGELGYYDLRDPAIMRRQIELAVLHGVSAFCFYAYWFAGKRLLDGPLEAFLADDTLDLEFLVCWANENWTRTWDGRAQDVLIGQSHSPEDDVAFISEMSRYLRDRRYLRVDGKPVLLVYRPSLLPDPVATATRWRTWCRENGVGEILLAYVQSFDKTDPADFGFDVAVEFPPNNTGPLHVPELEATPGFEGQVYDWVELANRSNSYPEPTYPVWRGVCPSWDNTARRGKSAAILWGANPDGFCQWLVNAGAETIARCEPSWRLVFINAWNEWAEGAYLEPDEAQGYQWLHAVRDAQITLADGPVSAHGAGVVVVTHDMHPHGAQLLALAMTRTLGRFGLHVEVVALGEGELASEFARTAPLHVLARDEDASAEMLADRLVQRGFTTAICNTSVSGGFASRLRRAGADVTGLVHELPSVLSDPAVSQRAESLTSGAHRIVFPADKVARDYPHALPQDTDAIIRPQGIYKPIRGERSAAQRQALRERLGLPFDATVALGVGYGDHRKGLDLFAEMAANRPTAADGSAVHFVWVGRHDTYDRRIVDAVAAAGSDRLHLVGYVSDPEAYYQAADVLVLSSREDPFPSVVLEALMCGLPIVAGRDRTGQDDLIVRSGGRLVETLSGESLAAGVIDAVRSDSPADAHARRALVTSEFNFQRYMLDLLAATPAALPRVSVVVPNYNYERFIGDRLRQVLDQTYPVYELIVLDDASTDGSVTAIHEAISDAAPHVRVVVNEENSGSVFAQWRLGSQLATGDLVWIAEADDVADPTFLASLVPEFWSSGTALVYSESRQLGADGSVLAHHYRDYVSDIHARDWTRRYRASGRDEITECLAIRNTIPNVSAVLFDATTLRLAMERVDLSELPTAGDWRVYLEVLQHGDLVFVSRALNGHRRHQHSVVASGLGRRHLMEIMAMQADIAERFSVSEPVRRLAVAYAERLYEQFNLGRASALHQDEQFAPLVAKIVSSGRTRSDDRHDATEIDKGASGHGAP